MSTVDPSIDSHTQKVRQVLFNRCRPNFKEAPDVIQATQDHKKRLKDLVKNLVSNFPMTKESLPEAKGAIQELSKQYSTAIADKRLQANRPPRCEDFTPNLLVAR